MTLEFYRRIVEAGEKSSPLWIATITESEGSGPAATGMKMLVDRTGRVDGTIGGGDIEKRVIDRIAREHPDETVVWTYDLGADGDEGEKTTMICGGLQRVLIEPLWNAPPLTIIGGGHCGVALSTLAASTGFAVTVIDDRPEWADPARHPDAVRCVCAPYATLRDHVAFGDRASFVIMTHAHKHDELALRLLVTEPHLYLGMIGSAAKVRIVLNRLHDEGVDADTLRRVFTPVGFAIGSHTPEEIAVSILAQLIAVKNGVTEVRLNGNPFP